MRKLLVITISSFLLLLQSTQGQGHGQIQGHDSGKDQFVVVVDAGSTKTRLNVFKINSVAGIIVNRGAEKIKSCKSEPGLGSLNDAAAGRIINKLLTECDEHIQTAEPQSVPFVFRATAGLRQLNVKSPGFVKKLLAAVREGAANFINKSPLYRPFEDDDVAIMSLEQEAKMAFVSTNYQFSRLNLISFLMWKTLPIMEAGGGSMQTAYQPFSLFNFFTFWRLPDLTLKGWDSLGIETFRRNFYHFNDQGEAVTDCLHPEFVGSYNFNRVKFNEIGVPIPPGVDRYQFCYKKARLYVEREIRDFKPEFTNNNLKILGGFSYAVQAGLKVLKSFKEGEPMIVTFSTVVKINKHFCENPAKEGKYLPYYCMTTSQLRATLDYFGLNNDNVKIEFLFGVSWTRGVALTVK